MHLSEEIFLALKDLSNPDKANFFPKFFKAYKGGYGEGDHFLGVIVPDCRKVAQFYSDKIDLNVIEKLIKSEFHEVRLTALFLLIKLFDKGDIILQKQIIVFYLGHTRHINNWDLVDTSCYKILGRYCYENNEPQILEELSNSPNLWEKRMAVVGTLYYIKKNNFSLTKKLVINNLKHSHDLMHKANGWMLREMGKRNIQELTSFLNLYYHEMPRTSLRYAIEKMNEVQRQDYLKGRI